MVNKERLQSIVKHPDFPVIEEIIAEYIKPLLSMDKIDLTQDAPTIKGEIQAKLAIHKQLSNLLQDLMIFKTVIDREKTSMK